MPAIYSSAGSRWLAAYRFPLSLSEVLMAESALTKRALASALTELMAEIPFEKIDVAQICEKCGMSRKSFYYHFKDKYDLVNWIFDIDFLTVLDQDVNDDHVAFLKAFCALFYEKQGFYRNALSIKGQNSFPEHFKECLIPIFRQRYIFLTGEEKPDSFGLAVLADVCVCVLERWLLEKDCIPPKQFISVLESLLDTAALSLHAGLEGLQ